MKQTEFEHRHRAEWQAFEKTLSQLNTRPSRRTARGRDDDADGKLLEQLPQRYRKLATHLQLARDRHYSSRLVGYLENLATLAHQRLYRAPPFSPARVSQFLINDFPCAVRDEARLFWLCAALLFLPMLAMGSAVYFTPELIYTLVDHPTVEELEYNYRPSVQAAESGNAENRVLMFGFYIYNNIGIGFRSFAGGMLFAVGTVFILVFNGVMLGAIAGYLNSQAYFHTFFPFVIAHGAFELTGIVLAGAAGCRLGLALLAPGRYRRGRALMLAAKRSIPLINGTVALLLLAAFIEAFWSSQVQLPLMVRYGVGALCWIAIIAYLGFAGRKSTTPAPD